MSATVNPDFAQVEQDPAVLNLTVFETFFPEKRTFFTQGMELFNQVGGEGMPQTLFYSRRIGRAPQGPTPDDPTRKTDGQIDDNQDDMGRDVNDREKLANAVNRKGH